MLVKTYKLEGPALDWAVAKVEGLLDQWGACAPVGFRPTRDWSQAGPLLTQYGISTVIKHHGLWMACMYDVNDDPGFMHTAKDQLTAAMRCLVAAWLGREVEVPDELA